MLQQPPEFFSNHCCAFVVCCYLPHLRNLVFIIFRYFYFKSRSVLPLNKQSRFCDIKMRHLILKVFQKQFIPKTIHSNNKFKFESILSFLSDKKTEKHFRPIFCHPKNLLKMLAGSSFFFLSFFLSCFSSMIMMR